MNRHTLGYAVGIVGVVVGLVVLVAGEALEGHLFTWVGIDGLVLVGGTVILVAVGLVTLMVAWEEPPAAVHE